MLIFYPSTDDGLCGLFKNYARLCVHASEEVNYAQAPPPGWHVCSWTTEGCSINEVFTYKYRVKQVILNNIVRAP